MSDQRKGQHTPGPWEVHDYEIYGHIDAERSMSTHVCTVVENDQDRANAALIGAAPDLLAALQSIAELCDDDNGAHWLTKNDTTRALARAAIAKAEGRT